MGKKRIIPCLDIKNGRTVKGVNFVGLKDIGDPVELALRYQEQGADQIAMLDITATKEGSNNFAELVAKVSGALSIPLIAGGGINSLESAAELLDAGATKITINSAAVRTPQLIDDVVGRYGGEALVVAVDAKQVEGRWMVVVSGGSKLTDRELMEWVEEVERRGAGEILFTSMDHDGTKNGYPIELYAALSARVGVPIIASGGAGSVAHIVEVLSAGGASAALAASIFHYGQVTIGEIKRELNRLKI